MPRRRRNLKHREPPRLPRRRPRLEPKRRFILFCEGRNTEPAYFEAIRRACRNALISVKTHGGAGVPRTIAEKAAEEAGKNRRRKKDSFEEGDQVWAVFDRDEHPRFDEAVRLCEDKGVRVARSNPCFELWLILHEEDHDRPENRRAMQGKLKRLRPEYEIDGARTPDCADLVTRVEEAERRGEAQLLKREQGGDPYGNPSTTVGRLTREIREASDAASPAE